MSVLAAFSLGFGLALLYGVMFLVTQALFQGVRFVVGALSPTAIHRGMYRHRLDGTRVEVTGVRMGSYEGVTTRLVYYLRHDLPWEMSYPEHKFRTVYAPE